MFTALDIERFSARTLPALLRHTAARVPDRCFVREVPNPRSYNFAEFEGAVAATAQALSGLGIGAEDRVLFVAENSFDWQVVAWATQALRAVTCAAYSNLGPAALADIAQRVRPRCIFVSSEAQLKQLEPVLPALLSAGLKCSLSSLPMASAHPGLRHCVTSELAATPFEHSTWEERVSAVRPSDVFLLLFTSGTSGRQKGVRLTQDAFVRSLEGGRACTGMSEHDNGLMFLPFAHVAGQCQFALAVALGHSLILVSRREDLQLAFEHGPTYVFAVPLVYEKLKARVLERIESMPKPIRDLLRESVVALSHGKPTVSASLRGSMLRALGRTTVGKRLRSQLGGRLRMVASGGALAPVGLVRFFESIGIPFLSLYGMTETCGLISSSDISGPRLSDTVGKASPDLTLHVAGDGELCIKGPLLMNGYLELEDHQTAFDAEGFFHTGDLVERDAATGQLRIVGRSKDLIVLSTGKKLSPELLEAKICELPLVQAAVVVGDGQPCVSAVLFVNSADVPQLMSDPDTFFASVLERLVTDSEFERPKRLLVVPNLPTDFPEFVTPTLKLRRASIVTYFSPYIERLYTTDGGSVTLFPPRT